MPYWVEGRDQGASNSGAPRTQPCVRFGHRRKCAMAAVMAGGGQQGLQRVSTTNWKQYAHSSVHYEHVASRSGPTMLHRCLHILSASNDARSAADYEAPILFGRVLGSMYCASTQIMAEASAFSGRYCNCRVDGSKCCGY